MLSISSPEKSFEQNSEMASDKVGKAMKADQLQKLQPRQEFHLSELKSSDPGISWCLGIALMPLHIFCFAERVEIENEGCNACNTRNTG